MIKLRSRQPSITWKLFLVTSVMFIAFIFGWFMFQSLFFEKFYSVVKEKQSIQAIQDFCGKYNKNNWNRSDLDIEMTRMTDLYDIQIIIINEYGNDKYGGIEMVVKSMEGKDINVDLHDVKFIDSMKGMGLKAGAKIKVKGIFIQDGSVMYPYEINVDNCEWRRDRIAERNGERSWLNDNTNLKKNNTVQIEGMVEYLRVMKEFEYIDIQSPFLVLKTALKQWQEENVKLPAQRLVQEYKDITTGTRYKMLIFPFTAKSASREAVFAIVPMQPLDEAMKLIKEYLGYVLIVALVFVLVLSFIFYKMVSKPLIKINEAALKMSRIDFSEQCEIHTHDELGSLSNSLNIMSSRLNSTMIELKEFVSNASHELKTPIAVMGVYVEALRDDIRKDKRDWYIERLQNEVDRMNSLVQDMLELSRMESNTRMLNIEVVDLYYLTEAILDEFDGLLQEKCIRLITNIEQDSAIVIGDHTKLGQVIRNFISNALRHTPRNGTIWIETEKCDKKVTFMIENEGISIPDEKLNKVWDRFYRIEALRTGNSNGTGLGLAISAKILQMHNAEYGVMNTQKGVMFFFTLG